MTLKGWNNPLPEWLEKAVIYGSLKVIEIKGIEYLQGSVRNPLTGTLVTFE